MYIEKNAINAPKIRRLYAQGVSRAALKERFGISSDTLSKILRNIAYVDPNYTPPSTIPGYNRVSRGQTREAARNAPASG